MDIEKIQALLLLREHYLLIMSASGSRLQTDICIKVVNKIEHIIYEEVCP